MEEHNIDSQNENKEETQVKEGKESWWSKEEKNIRARKKKMKEREET